MAIARRSPHINVMVEAAEKAGRSLIRDFGEVEHLQVSKKGPGDFVSAADHRSEKTLLILLQKARPTYALLMEESGDIKGSDPQNRWIVDPLDGTTNFLHGLPHWSVSIALERDKEIVAGVVYDPIKDEMFWAEKGMGAFINNRRLRVAGRETMIDAMLSVGEILTNPDIVPPAGALVRRFGSACLDLCWVAAGRIDAYHEKPLKAWDCAAGGLIAREAGAVVTDAEGGKDFVFGNGILAANAPIHAALLKHLKAQENKKIKSAS